MKSRFGGKPHVEELLVSGVVSNEQFWRPKQAQLRGRPNRKKDFGAGIRGRLFAGEDDFKCEVTGNDSHDQTLIASRVWVYGIRRWLKGR